MNNEDDAPAQYRLGNKYNNGDGVPQDSAKAVEWLLKAAELYRKAAEQGDADAQFSLGGMYEHGEGVPKDSAKAVEWYRKAAEQGDALAQITLGLIYETDEGVKDSAKALEWYLKAAEQGDVDAQLSLGRMYQGDGEGELYEDSEEAVKWYRKAAEQSVEAQIELGSMYREGEGVPKDDVLAYTFYNLASAFDDEAAEARDLLAKEMTRDQIAEAQRLTREWKPTVQSK